MARVQISVARPDDALEVAALHIAAWRVAYEGILPVQTLAQLSMTARAQQWRDVILHGSPALGLAREVPEPQRAPLPLPLPVSLGAQLSPPRPPPALGFVCYGRCRDADLPATWGEIWALYVQPSHWSRGIGHALWQHACAQLRGQGFQHVSLWVLADNERALHFYRRQGMVPDPGVQQTLERGGARLRELRYHASLLPEQNCGNL